MSHNHACAIPRGDPSASPRTWESHPIARLLRQRAGPTRRCCRTLDVDSYKTPSSSPLSSDPHCLPLEAPLQPTCQICKRLVLEHLHNVVHATVLVADCRGDDGVDM